MRILFLCQYFPPEMGAPAARTFEHAREWVRQGHHVTVLCGKPNHPSGVVPEEYRGSLLYREVVDGVDVMRCWLFTTPNAGVIRRSLSFFTFMCSAVFFGLFAARGPWDVVAATSPQLLCGLAGWVLAFLKRRPFILEVRDLWPKQIIDLGTLRNPLVIALLRRLERFLYRRARAIIAVADASRDEIIASGVPAAKVHTVTNGIDEDFFRPLDRVGPFRAAHGWGDDTLLIMYIGTHGLSQGLHTVLEAAERLRARTDLHFVLVGSGAERRRLMRRADEAGLDNVTFLPPQPKADMPACYAAADLCLVPLRRLDVFLLNIPSKMFEIMACARPIILGVEGQAKALLEQAGAGIAVTPEDPQALAGAIERLAADPNLRRQLGDRGRAHAVAHYSRRQKAADCLDIFAEVAGVR